jgi:hypothetical protein
MNPTARTIRFFVCSIFADVREERDVLQDKIFPRLQQHFRRVFSVFLKRR